MNLHDLRLRVRGLIAPRRVEPELAFRDARGTAFVDQTARDILYALRSFRRTPLVVLTIVTTVAVGLGLVAVVFTFFNVLVFRVDAVRNPGELFAVERPRTRDGPFEPPKHWRFSICHLPFAICHLPCRMRFPTSC